MKPLVSFCLKSYNGRRYLREALDGAFAQTYRPLEIVISDDASTDGSWENIQEEVNRRDPVDGVSVVLNRNPENLGNLGNWEKICSLAHGELLVKADGDDVSLPERTERIVAAWLADGKRATVICHSGWQIGLRGEPKGRMRKVCAEDPLGAAMAYSLRLYTFFGKSAADGRLMDDEVYSRRALMLGSSLCIPDRLVRYRLGSGATSAEWNMRRRLEFCLNGNLAVRKCVAPDLEKLRTLSEDAYRMWTDRLDREWCQVFGKYQLVTGRIWNERLLGLRAMPPTRLIGASMFLRLAFLMPRVVGNTMLFSYVLVRNALRRMGVL